MTKTTYKVGDKVRILDAKAISTCAAKDGDILEVVSIDRSNDPVLLDVDEGHLTLFTSELKYIEKVAEQVAKFKVGDKVRIIKDMGGIAGVKIGTVATVIEVDSDGDVRVDVINKNGVPAFFIAHEVELISPKLTKNQRITTLEQTVATLQAEVEALKAVQKLPTMTVKADVDVATIAESLAKAIDKHTPKSPNEQRKAIIAEAKAFVEKYSGVVKADTTPYTKGAGSTTVKLFVNKKKRIVTAIPHLVNANYTVHGDKKFAKCAPDDVFNADIGKAIALGRALGLDVSKFEKAVQPSEVAVGQVHAILWEESKKPTGEVIAVGSVSSASFKYVDGGWASDYQILDDTEAQY